MSHKWDARLIWVKEQSYQGLHCSPFRLHFLLHLLDALIYNAVAPLDVRPPGMWTVEGLILTSVSTLSWEIGHEIISTAIPFR